MLKDYKYIYFKKANQLKNLNNLSVNDLCNFYLDTTDVNKKDIYLSAIIYKCWYLINNCYYSQKNIFFSKEDYYDCLISSILQTLEQCVWRKEESSLYNDQKGPEKAISVIYNSKIANFCKATNTKKRRTNYASGGIYYEDLIGNKHEPFEYDKNYNKIYQDELIKKYINKNNYYTAICLWSIINNNFVKKDGMFSWYKLKRYINKELDLNWCLQFSKKYNIDIDKLQKELALIQKQEYWQTDNTIKKMKKTLKNDIDFKNIVMV